MSHVSRNRVQTHALGAAIAVALSSMVAGSAFAANRVELNDLNLQQVNSGQLGSQARMGGQGVSASDRHARLLGLDRESSLVELNRTKAANGAQNFRYQQTFRGLPIFGEHVIVSEQDGAVRLLYGRMVTGLAGELPATSPKLAKTQALAIAKRAALGSRVLTMQSRNEDVRQMIYVDGKDRAHVSYVVDFFADKAGGGAPTRPQVIVDANSGKVLRQWEGLTTDLIGTGPGGNTKTGEYEYGTDYGFNDVEVNGANCTMNNTNVKSVDLDGPGGDGNTTAYVYACPRNTYKAINGAFSPINDAHFFGGVVYNMYSDYLSEAPLTFQLTMKVHYATSYENAFWDGSSMTFGDGASTFFPLVGLDVSAHEVSHGYTEQNSGLIYDNQSGGMNEAFSDMAGEAADLYFRGAPDFLVGAEIFKAPGQALRYMYDPPLDGISIDNFADYNDSINVHYTSGIYNKAFWALAVTPGWDAESAFRVFANANRDYWIADETMLDGSCKVETAAADNGYNVADVQAAFAIVGLDCADPGEPVADFTFTRNDLTVDFTDASSDSDGTIVSWDWDFGDGATSTEQNPSHTYAVESAYDVTLIVTDDDGITDTIVQSVSLLGGELENGVPVTGIDGDTDSEIFWTLEVPAGATNLQFQTTGSVPDADLYVKFGAPPTTSDYDCRGFTSTSNELCVVADGDIQAGTYHVMVHGFSAYTDLTLVGSYDTGGGCSQGGVLSNGVPVTGIACGSGTSQYWTLVVPAGATNLKFTALGGTGMYEIYVKEGSDPTPSDYDCKQTRRKAKPCTVSAPAAGTYHVLIYGDTAYSGVTLTGSYDVPLRGGSTGGKIHADTRPVAIRDNATVQRSIQVTGKGRATGEALVSVNIATAYRGDLKVELVSPSGRVYALHNRSGGSADNLVASYRVSVLGEPLNGQWKLRVNDNAQGDQGLVKGWSIRF